MKLTVEEALSLLPDGDWISVVESPKQGEVTASKWARETIEVLIWEFQHGLKLGGQLACATGRGLVIERPSMASHGSKLHVLCKQDRLNELLNDRRI